MQSNTAAGPHQSVAERNAARIRAPWAQPELVGKNNVYEGTGAVGAVTFGETNVYIGPSLHSRLLRATILLLLLCAGLLLLLVPLTSTL
jgi:hypothetical protein